MKITVIGAGYVGLITGVCFSETGMTVACMDIDKEKIDKLTKGISPIFEPGLEEMIQRNASQGRLFFTTSFSDAVKDSEVIFITVGTPLGSDGFADVSAVVKTASDIGMVITSPTTIVMKSTAPIGTCKKIKKIIQDQLDKRGASVIFDVVSNPEFLKEGSAIEDFMSPDRIVVGIEGDNTKGLIDQIYKPFLVRNYRVMYMDITSAEMVKYASNAMLAVRISFMNEMAKLCEKVGSSVNFVREGMSADSRIGSKFLYAGAGYGGSCFPKDVQAFASQGESLGVPMSILKATDQVNRLQKEFVFMKIKKRFPILSGRVFGVWGLSYKPKTDDIRESPSIIMIEKLLKEGAIVKAYDPQAMENSKKKLGDHIDFSNDPYEAVHHADALLLFTEWHVFRSLDYKRLRKNMKMKIIFDGRNMYRRDEVEKEGFEYFGIGA